MILTWHDVAWGVMAGVSIGLWLGYWIGVMMKKQEFRVELEQVRSAEMGRQLQVALFEKELKGLREKVEAHTEGRSIIEGQVELH